MSKKKYQAQRNRNKMIKRMFLFLFIVLILGFGSWSLVPKPIFKPDCSSLIDNPLFSIYPNYQSIQNKGNWMNPASSVEDQRMRMDRIMYQMQQSSGGIATVATGDWIYQNPMNIRIWEGLINGAAMATTQGDDGINLEVGLQFLETKTDDVEIAIVWAHDTVHYINALNGYDPKNNFDLCAEMQAYAWETIVYAEFRDLGYYNLSMEERFQLLQSLQFDWSSLEWARHIYSISNK